MGNCITEQITQEWNVVFASEVGTAHTKTAAPCQDYSSMQIIETSTEPILVLCCSDGAGSAQFAHEASRIACDEMQHSILNGLLYLGDVASIEHENVRSWYEGVRMKLADAAAGRNSALSEFACTLLIAVLGHEVSLFAQVGDGAIVYADSSASSSCNSMTAQLNFAPDADQASRLSDLASYKIAFWPDNGEYMNITNFITSPGLEHNLRIQHVSAGIDQVALFTDGLELLALDFKQKAPHKPFFEPMFERLSRETHPQNLEPLLREFLQSAAVNERTDDDKTLMLGSRIKRTD